ncbi:PCMD domain-containing protein [Bacteroides stercorirosoris]|uniref:DUF5018 domain-containing protein n=1 Tax=Bacteroides stercorirosoris TaxID=871324 RepID=A0A413GZH0_9BACE|nr:PCMD domain-containing protein [Bacteroides stercorirosoris]OKZ07266.1 MAG: hypothetical protein BHV75_17745 [Bacteroides oleiciplenus]RGX76573.1 DUF5018 domain-containing protein [Bacteroides stercorirosoris]
MKKNLFYLFALICSVSLFTSCSDDDDPVYPIEEELAGTYKGTLDIELDGNPVGVGLPKNITIAKSGNNIISLELKDFSFMGNNLGTIKLEKCALKQNGTSYSFTGNQELNLANGIGKCNVNVAGTLNNGKAEVNLDIAVEQLGETVKVVYKGDKLTGSESSEAQITSFVFKDASIITEQPIIDDATGKITFKVLDDATDEELAALVPTIEISLKATISPATGVKQNFASDVTYTVIAEDGTVKEYIVSLAGRQVAMKFPFDEWKSVGAGKSKHDEPIEETLATSATAASLLWLYGIEGFPLYKETEDVVAGEAAAKLVTMDTSAKMNSLVPAITSGSVFTGKFVLDMKDRLNSTKFGVAYEMKPAYFRGWYKYTPGDKFIDGTGATKPEDVVEHPEITDECAIQAVLYEAEDAEGNEVTLTGNNINSSEYRVAVAVLDDGTAKAAYTYFDIPFTYVNGKTYESGKTYKLAIVCASSKDGDAFKGAGGSTLWIDELEIIGE